MQVKCRSGCTTAGFVAVIAIGAFGQMTTGEREIDASDVSRQGIRRQCLTGISVGGRDLQ